MSWVFWLAFSLGGYLAVATVISRFVYRDMTFDNKIGPAHDGWVATYANGRHAGKAWAVSNTWGLWAALGPPALVIYGAAMLLWFLLKAAGKGAGFAGRGVAWYIKTEDLSRPAKALKPRLVTTADATVRAELELAKVEEEIRQLQQPPLVPRESDYGDGWKRELLPGGNILWTPKYPPETDA